MSSIMTSRLAAELDYAFERNGWTPEQVKRLSAGNLLDGIREVIEGRGEIKLRDSVVLTLGDDFNPEDFFGKGWKIIPEETDERGEALTELNLSKVLFKTMLREGEPCIKGEEKLRRSKEVKHIRLGGKAFKTCWDNRHLLPESWRRDEDGNIRYLFFDGIVLLRPDGDRYVPYLCFRDGEWDWSAHWLGHGFFAENSSAVLAS